MSLDLGFTEEIDETAEDVKNALEAIEPDELTPKQALDALYQLKAVLEKQ